jgi:hypothetical protein
MLAEVDVRAIPQSSFSFGDVSLEFESGDSNWLAYIDRRYGSFAGGCGNEPFRIRFEPTSGPLPAGLPTPLAAHLEAVDCAPTPRGYRIETSTSSCEIDMVSRQATLRGPSAMYPLDNLLRHLLPLLVEDGLIVHSALVECGASGLLASGPSGAGKSTLACLARGRALSDELAVVKMNGRAASAIALPFWNARRGRTPLRAILHLSHARSHRLERIGSGAAMRRLASQVLWPVWDERAIARSFSSLTDIAEAVPAFDLGFAPTEDVWDFLDKECA